MTTADEIDVGLSDVAALVERVAAALRFHNIEAIVVDTADEARRTVLELIPDGAEVHSGKSKTLDDVGLFSELVESGRYDALRPRLIAMDRQTLGREMRKMTAAPDFMLGSVAAIFHIRRPGDGQNTVTNIVLGLLAAFVAYGRFVIAPF